MTELEQEQERYATREKKDLELVRTLIRELDEDVVITDKLARGVLDACFGNPWNTTEVYLSYRGRGIFDE